MQIFMQIINKIYSKNKLMTGVRTLTITNQFTYFLINHNNNRQLKTKPKYLKLLHLISFCLTILA